MNRGNLRLAILALALGAAVSAAVPARAADLFQADAVHSSVVFRVKHMNTSYAWGRFNEISGTFALDEKDPAQSRLEFLVKSASVDTGNEKRDQHLKGPDFFNTVQYPTITFQSKSVATTAPNTFEVSGDLTLHGVTKPVTLKVTRTGSGKDMKGTAIAGIESTFAIRRADYQMNKMAPAIGDDVWINVSVEGVKK